MLGDASQPPPMRKLLAGALKGAEYRRFRHLSLKPPEPELPSANAMPDDAPPHTLLPGRQDAARMVVPGGVAFAALDLGTNNCRLLVGTPSGPGFRVVDSFSRIVRLGEGLAATGQLSEVAMDRAIGALGACADKLAKRPVRQFQAVATEACRRAGNGAAFLARVAAETGLRPRIISAREEAELAMESCAPLMEPGDRRALLFDIGGGSSELAWLDFRGGRPKRQGRMAASIRSWQSMPVGVVSIAEKFGGIDVTRDNFEAMVAHVAGHLREFRGRLKLRQMIGDHSVHLIGTSGTVTTLAGLHLGLERYERQKVDGLWMSAGEVDVTMEALLGMNFDRRVSHPCIGRDRADLVLPGCAIFEAIRREWPTERVRVADRGLREGILISLMDEDRSFGRPPVPGRVVDNG